MNIIIAGTGEVGFHLSKLLAQESHSIVIIDHDKKALEKASHNLDVSTIKGDVTSIKTLEIAGAKKADLLIAVTSSQQTNILSCSIGKNFGVKKCIARISNSELLHRRDIFDLSSLGIDEVIYPEALGANEIKSLLKESAVTDSLEFDGGLLHLMGIMIDGESELKDKTLGESAYLNPDTNYTPVAIVRDIEQEIHNETIIPRSHNILKEGEIAYFIAEANKGVDKVLSLAGKENLEIKNIMIFGGSPLAYMTAKYLSKKYNIKLVCDDIEKCERFADELSNVMVINGSATNIELMQEDDLDTMDAFLALSYETEKNLDYLVSETEILISGYILECDIYFDDTSSQWKTDNWKDHEELGASDISTFPNSDRLLSDFAELIIETSDPEDLSELDVERVRPSFRAAVMERLRDS